MPTTASHGLPYPDDSAFVIDGPSDMQALAEAVDNELSAVAAATLSTAQDFAFNDETAWAALPSLSGTVYGGVTPSYRRDRSGNVHLRGIVENPGITIATLPAGFRPVTPLHFAVYTFETATVEPYVAVDSTGAVTIPTDSNMTIVSLAGVVFYAEG